MKYKIKMFSDWHVGAGLSAGAESDAEILKDENNFPFIPGKTIKGLLKDALLEMPDMDEGVINSIFGYEVIDKETNKVKRTHEGKAFFSNATLGITEKKEITPLMADYLYKNVSYTAIDEKGVADNKSLRTMQVCMPIVLEGEISGLKNEEQIEVITKALKWVRHLGVNRNRGLGRCQILKIDNNIGNDGTVF